MANAAVVAIEAGTREGIMQGGERAAKLAALVEEKRSLTDGLERYRQGLTQSRPKPTSRRQSYSDNI